MKKKYRWMLMLAVTAAVCICGCANKTGTSGSAGSGSAAGGASGAGSAVQENGNGSQSGENGNSQEQAAGADNTYDASSQSGENGNGQEQAADADNTYDASSQSGENQAAGDTVTSGWDGTYASTSGEVLSISTADEHTISFSFSVSGISGAAGFDGNEAVYNGDDGNQVIFDLSGTTINVSVLNAEGQDEPATFSGMYTLQ